MSRPFEARYRSACAVCEEWITPGQMARFESGLVVHDSCPEPTLGGWVDKKPCPACFQVPSVNGSCGCEDLSPEWTI